MTGYNQGQDNPNAKLTSEDVAEIRAMIEAEIATWGDLPKGIKAALARRYGVSEPTIARIANSHGWKGE